MKNARFVPKGVGRTGRYTSNLKGNVKNAYQEIGVPRVYFDALSIRAAMLDFSLVRSSSCRYIMWPAP
jgi:hypothetical protein